MSGGGKGEEGGTGRRTRSLDDLCAARDLQRVLGPLAVLEIGRRGADEGRRHREGQPSSAARSHRARRPLLTPARPSPSYGRPTRECERERAHLVGRNVPQVGRRQARVALLDADPLVDALLDGDDVGLHLLELPGVWPLALGASPREGADVSMRKGEQGEEGGGDGRKS